MTSAPYTLGEVLDHLEHAIHSYPGFAWHGTDTHCPNGRYVVDHVNATVYLDRRLAGQESFRAFIEACVELEASTAYTDDESRSIAS